MDPVRVWKDLDYRESLGEEEAAAAPPNPAGMARLSASELDQVIGAGTQKLFTWGCCAIWHTVTTVAPVPCIISLEIC